VGLFRKSDKRLDSARVDFAAAKAKLLAIDAKEVEALGNGASFAAWRDERAAAELELDRLVRLVSALEDGAEAAAKYDAEETFRKRTEAARKNNAEVAGRIKSEGPKLAAALKSLARDVALSQIETAAINRELPLGVPPLRDANFLARSMPAVPRQNVGQKVLEMWVRASDGSLIGNQADVISEDGRSGHVQLNRTLRIDCVRRRFRKIEYHHEITQTVPEDFHRFIRLPAFDLPGVGFDGSILIEQAVAAINPHAPEPERKESGRFIRTELVELDRWPAPGSSATDEAVAETND
jgi:hypothetical protein